MEKIRYSQLYNNQSSSREDTTKVVRREQKTQADTDNRKSLDENAIVSDTDWESETENNDDEQDEVVQASLDFHKQEVKKVEPRKSDLRRAEIDPKMRGVKEIRQQMLQMEQSDDLRHQLLIIYQVHRVKQTTKNNSDAFRVSRGSGKEGDTLQWPDERHVW